MPEQKALQMLARLVAWKAQIRLTRRYRHLTAVGKAAPKVITAIARELVGFIRLARHSKETRSIHLFFGVHGWRRAGR